MNWRNRNSLSAQAYSTVIHSDSEQWESGSHNKFVTDVQGEIKDSQSLLLNNALHKENGVNVCLGTIQGFDLSRPLSAPRAETHAGQLRATALTSDPHASISPSDNARGPSDSITLDISSASL